MKKCICLIYRFVLIFLFVACAPKTEGVKEISIPTMTQRAIRPTLTSVPTIAIGDGGLITGEPCGPPCFWGIEPGKSSKSDAYQMLVQKEFIGSCATIDQNLSAINQGVGGWGCEAGFDIEFKQSTEIINYIRFELDPPITLQDIIEKHGNPDIVKIVNVGSDEFPNSFISIYYSVFQSALLVQEECKSIIECGIKPTTTIHVVVYFDDESFNESFAGIPWRGYGSYP